MLKSKDLSLHFAGSVVLAMLVGTSAFAESRHLGGTRGGGSHPSQGRMSVRAPRFESRGFSGRSFSGRSFSGRSFSGRNFSSRNFSSRSFSGRGSSGRSFSGRGSSGRNFGSRSTPAPRFGSRGPSNFGRGVPFNGYNSGSRFYGRGRIDRVAPYRGGYHVWLGGWGYPFFVPYRFYDPFRFRIGLFIGFNAFYDPLGYYSVYGWPYYGYPPTYSGGYYSDRYYRNDDNNDESVLRGVVESVDLHSGQVVVNDEASHRTVTALLPPRDRRVDEIRVGDYVELSGSWVRGRGYEFDADRLDSFEPKR